MPTDDSSDEEPSCVCPDPASPRRSCASCVTSTVSTVRCSQRSPSINPRAGGVNSARVIRRIEKLLPEAEIVTRIAARNAARQAKDFKESDRIRDELAKLGVVLKDSKDGTTWEVAR